MRARLARWPDAEINAWYCDGGASHEIRGLTRTTATHHGIRQSLAELCRKNIESCQSFVQLHSSQGQEAHHSVLEVFLSVINILVGWVGF